MVPHEPSHYLKRYLNFILIISSQVRLNLSSRFFLQLCASTSEIVVAMHATCNFPSSHTNVYFMAGKFAVTTSYVELQEIRFLCSLDCIIYCEIWSVPVNPEHLTTRKSQHPHLTAGNSHCSDETILHSRSRR